MHTPIGAIISSTLALPGRVEIGSAKGVGRDNEEASRQEPGLQEERRRNDEGEGSRWHPGD